MKQENVENTGLLAAALDDINFHNNIHWLIVRLCRWVACLAAGFFPCSRLFSPSLMHSSVSDGPHSFALHANCPSIGSSPPTAIKQLTPTHTHTHTHTHTLESVRSSRAVLESNCSKHREIFEKNENGVKKCLHINNQKNPTHIRYSELLCVAHRMHSIRQKQAIA